MQCPYYAKQKFTKRLKGIMGFCELQKCDIIREESVGRIPYRYCEGQKGKSNLQCGVYIHFGRNHEMK